MEIRTDAENKGGGREEDDSKAGDFEREYIRLRTILDGVEICALRYCLEGARSSDRIYRIKEMDRVLMPVIEQLKKLMDKLAVPGGERCPDGFYECDGCCVPYPCPEAYDSASALSDQKEGAE